MLDGGEILINAGDNDEKVELSQIVPARGGDADAKVTSSLELADVVRQAANLGASYPQIVAILEKANKQRNLPGQLVVDAVPAASPVYLDAILGRDLHAKRDAAVGRASAETDPTAMAAASWACSIANTTRTPPRPPPRRRPRRRRRRRRARPPGPRLGSGPAAPAGRAGLAGRRDRRDSPGPVSRDGVGRPDRRQEG